ncbi:YpzG family protein [Bacillus testis]|uniref:YpzG family protein n=1 Tax=Bacillus testis TaxID=1622072 RepID=UPI0008410A5E|nr:YpzG family protein [Bacillus testis]
MVNKRYRFGDRQYKSPFETTWTSQKHAKARINGQTQQTQSLIILERQTRKQS